MKDKFDQFCSRVLTTLPYLHLRHQVKSIGDVKRQQEAKLEELLKLTQGSAYWQKVWGHSDKVTLDIFLSHCPTIEYRDIEGSVRKVMDGEFSALFAPDVKPLMFAMTSGTTGTSKYIPVTQSTLKVLRQTWWFLGVNLLYENPGDHLGDVMNLSSSSRLETAPCGLPCGETTGQISDHQSLFVRLHYGLPAAFQEITDPTAKYYAYLRAGLRNANMQMIMTATPSTVTSLAGKLDEWSEDLIRDIHDGTFRNQEQMPRFLLDEHRSRLFWSDKSLAMKLEKIKSEKGHLLPKYVWPRMKLICCWLSGSFSHYRQKIKNLYGDVALRDVGLAAAEGHFSLPIANESSSCLLNVWGYFFEFEDHKGNLHLASDLQEGERYSMVVTTPGGLLRYRMQDIIQCTGHEYSIPLIEFERKDIDFVDLTGEKLTSYQISKAVQFSGM